MSEVEELMRQLEGSRSAVPAQRSRRTIHHTELPPGKASPEWESYREQLPRLLAEGREGEWAVFRGREIIGFYRTREEALAIGTGYPYQILERHPLCFIGYNKLLRSPQPSALAWEAQ